MAVAAVKRESNFERFSRQVERNLDELPSMGVAKLASVILNDNRGMFRESGRGSRLVGPSDNQFVTEFITSDIGRTTTGPSSSAYETARGIARAVLELNPDIKFRWIFPRGYIQNRKRRLAFNWYDAPPEIRAMFARTFPMVYLTKARVPYRIYPDDQEVRRAIRDSFSSAEFQIWLAGMIRRGFIRP